MRLLTETNDRWQACELGITDALWDGQASNGETRDSIRLEELQGVLRAPLKDWEEVLESQYEPPKGSLVLELVEGVIREKKLTKPLPQGLQ